MRDFDRVVLRTLSLTLAATGFIVACSTTTGDDPGPAAGDDAGADANVTPPGPLPDGATPDGATPPKTCTKNEDCESGVCNIATKQCAAASCKDGVKNAGETDIDCGGACPKCDTAKKCKVAADCASGVCKDTGKGLECQAPTSTDGVKNGTETGIDCGGTGNPKCADGQGCKDRADCTSDYCKAGVCTAILPGDGVQNGNETDVDCGGAGNARCDDALKCLVDADCKSDVCKDLADGMGLRCQAPSPTDGKKNGTETDVDCGGGGGNPGCAAGLNCVNAGDCASLGCNYMNKCAAGRSCTQRYGGDTCGFGGDGSVGPANWEDCCARAPVVPAAGPTAGQTVYVGKYQVTAGRMRAFLESVGYDVRAFVQQARADGKIPLIPEQGGNNAGYSVLESSWDLYLPTSFAGNNNAGELAERDQGDPTPQQGIYTSVSNHLGGRIFFGNEQGSTGCYVGSPGTHAFRFPDGQQDGAAPAHDQTVYDTKSMQCIPYLVAQAFCVWDGGRLILGQEHIAMWGAAAMPWAAQSTQVPATPADRGIAGDGSGTYWGCRFPWATDANHPQCGLSWPATTTIEYADYRYTYEWPILAGGDYIVHISAPGRTRGRGPAGHADVIGTNMGWTSDVLIGSNNNTAANNPGTYVAYDGTPRTATSGWTQNGSWEVHGYSKTGNAGAGPGQGWRTILLNKYGKLGLRCAYDAP